MGAAVAVVRVGHSGSAPWTLTVGQVGAHVMFPADEALWPQLYRTPSRVLFAPVNERFRFEFVDIPPGEYHAVVVRAGELEWSPRALARWAQRSERITLQSGEGPRIELSGR